MIESYKIAIVFIMSILSFIKIRSFKQDVSKKQPSFLVNQIVQEESSTAMKQIPCKIQIQVKLKDQIEQQNQIFEDNMKFDHKMREEKSKRKNEGRKYNHCFMYKKQEVEENLERVNRTAKSSNLFFPLKSGQSQLQTNQQLLQSYINKIYQQNIFHAVRAQQESVVQDLNDQFEQSLGKFGKTKKIKRIVYRGQRKFPQVNNEKSHNSKMSIEDTNSKKELEVIDLSIMENMKEMERLRKKKLVIEEEMKENKIDLQ